MNLCRMNALFCGWSLQLLLELVSMLMYCHCSLTSPYSLDLCQSCMMRYLCSCKISQFCWCEGYITESRTERAGCCFEKDHTERPHMIWWGADGNEAVVLAGFSPLWRCFFSQPERAVLRQAAARTFIQKQTVLGTGYGVFCLQSCCWFPV